MRDIVEISDIDRDSKIAADALGEDWGDGFFVQPELVVIDRDGAGNIVRTTPVNEVGGLEKIAEDLVAANKNRPYIADEVPTLIPLSRNKREQLAFIMAKRLFEWFDAQPPSPSALNPIHDGIPACASHTRGCPSMEKCAGGFISRGASRGEVFDWLLKVIGTRVTIANKKSKFDGFRPDMGTVTIHRSPVRGG